MSAKTKAYTETDVASFTKVLANLDQHVSNWENALNGTWSGRGFRQVARANLNAYTIARDAVARRLAKMQAAKAEAGK